MERRPTMTELSHAAEKAEAKESKRTERGGSDPHACTRTQNKHPLSNTSPLNHHTHPLRTTPKARHNAKTLKTYPTNTKPLPPSKTLTASPTRPFITTPMRHKANHQRIKIISGSPTLHRKELKHHETPLGPAPPQSRREHRAIKNKVLPETHKRVRKERRGQHPTPTNGKLVGSPPHRSTLPQPTTSHTIEITTT